MAALFPSPSVKPKGYGQLGNLSDVTPLGNVTVNGVTGIPGGANYALIQAVGGSVSWTDDGSEPGGNLGLGMVIVGGAEPQGFAGQQLRSMKLVGSGMVSVSFYQL
jgi:hypothetical protein